MTLALFIAGVLIIAEYYDLRERRFLTECDYYGRLADLVARAEAEASHAQA